MICCVAEPLLDCWDYWYAVPATKKYSCPNPQSTGTVFPLKKLVWSVFCSMGDVWSRSSFQVMMRTFFSAEVGKTVDCVLMTHPLVGFTDCNQTQFCCQWQWKFSRSLFSLVEHHRKWSCLAGASTCFRTQGTEYDLYQVTQNTQFQPVLGTDDYIFYQYWGNIYR